MPHDSDIRMMEDAARNWFACGCQGTDSRCPMHPEGSIAVSVSDFTPDGLAVFMGRPRAKQEAARPDVRQAALEARQMLQDATTFNRAETTNRLLRVLSDAILDALPPDPA